MIGLFTFANVCAMTSPARAPAPLDPVRNVLAARQPGEALACLDAMPAAVQARPRSTMLRKHDAAAQA